MARLIVLLLLALLAGALAADAADAEALAHIRAQMDAHPRVRAEFEQTRRMAELERPLVARGRMLLWGEAGVLWEIDEPVKSAIVLREDTTLRIDADGRRTARRAEDDAPAARIGRVLRSLLRGDTAALEQWFHIAARRAGERWSVTLTPRKGPMAAFLVAMQVSGDRFVKSVTIDETSGDSTEIRFHSHRDAAALSEQESRLLGNP